MSCQLPHALLKIFSHGHLDHSDGGVSPYHCFFPSFGSASFRTFLILKTRLLLTPRPWKKTLVWHYLARSFWAMRRRQVWSMALRPPPPFYLYNCWDCSQSDSATFLLASPQPRWQQAGRKEFLIDSLNLYKCHILKKMYIYEPHWAGNWVKVLPEIGEFWKLWRYDLWDISWSLTWQLRSQFESAPVITYMAQVGGSSWRHKIVFMQLLYVNYIMRTKQSLHIIHKQFICRYIHTEISNCLFFLCRSKINHRMELPFVSLFLNWRTARYLPCWIVQYLPCITV